LRSVAMKGEKLYQRTRNAASAESAKRAKTLVASHEWTELHPLFNDKANDMEVEREKMLAKVGGFRPQESIFEIGARRGGRKGNEEAIDAMRKIRSGLEGKKQRLMKKTKVAVSPEGPSKHAANEDDVDKNQLQQNDISMASESELEVIFSQPQSSSKKRSHTNADGDFSATFRDAENFMSYVPTSINLSEDRAYGVHSGSNVNFTEAARGATIDLGLDESGQGRGFGEARGIMRWDKRHKKYVARQNDEDGSKANGTRLVRGESGAKIAASFKSGRFDRWQKANRVGRVARVGESEKPSAAAGAGGGAVGKRYRHKQVRMPKAADRFREDYEVRKKKVASAKERTLGAAETIGEARGKKGELKSVDDIRKQRNLKQKRREKNARPHKSKGSGR